MEDILKNYREQIDTLDAELLYLFSRRFEIVKQIWIIKHENNITPLQNDRWNKLLQEKFEIWEELKLCKDFINDIWTRIHIESLKIEKSLTK